MYPKMLGEVIEAIETHFCDDKDIMVDCLLYLKNATCRREDIAIIDEWFAEHHKCERCGNDLTTYTYKEPHAECGMGVYEVMSSTYCSYCDGVLG